MNAQLDTQKVSLNRVVGAVFGAIYVLIGLVGFVIAMDVGFAATEGVNLVVFEINPLHNLVHVAVGIALAAAAYRGVQVSSVVNMAVGAVYLLVGVLGFFLVGSELNLLALNHADNLLHLASAAVLLGVGLTRR